MRDMNYVRKAIEESLKYSTSEGPYAFQKGVDWANAYSAVPLPNDYTKQSYSQVIPTKENGLLPAPAENNRQITKMFICEIPKLILHPNQLYEFMVAEDCQDCKDYFGKDPAPAEATRCHPDERRESGGEIYNLQAAISDLTARLEKAEEASKIFNHGFLKMQEDVSQSLEVIKIQACGRDNTIRELAQQLATALAQVKRLELELVEAKEKLEEQEIE
jgi:hypothetical protein